MAQQLNNSVARAFDILRLLGRGRARISVADVTRELGLNAITAHRFLKTLETQGALVQIAKGSYRLGYLLVDLVIGHATRIGWDSCCNRCSMN